MLPLTPQMCAAAYECLRAFPPMIRWRLPAAEAVEFRVVNRLDIQGECSRWLHDGTHIISVSSATVGHTVTLLGALAHEMVHMRQYVLGRDWRVHGDEFHRAARLVCRYHGFDPKAF